MDWSVTIYPLSSKVESDVNVSISTSAVPFHVPHTNATLHPAPETTEATRSVNDKCL